MVDVILYSYLCCVVCFFFFFKQKTAYEMRISDWSSDVCSSDLTPVRHADFVAGFIPLDSAEGADLLEDFLRLVGVHAAEDGEDAVAFQIGRASCRERVCQYV